LFKEVIVFDARGETTMNEQTGHSSRQELIEKLEKLFEDAGYQVPELRDFMKKALQNDQAVQLPSKPPASKAARKSLDSMASKLRDALRE
jgi:hypothetical protein